MRDVRREIWEPSFDVRQYEVMGQAWPIFVIDKFEENGIGERRYVGTRSFDANMEQVRPPETDPARVSWPSGLDS